MRMDNYWALMAGLLGRVVLRLHQPDPLTVRGRSCREKSSRVGKGISDSLPSFRNSKCSAFTCGLLVGDVR